MTDENLLKQYDIYSQHKEKFIDRSFMTNKFYNVLIIILFVLVFLMKDFVICNFFSASSIFAAAGAITSILWWINMDSYNFLIKIKISKALEEMEKYLPSQPYTVEFSTIRSSKRKKPIFLFNDMQKVFATLSFLTFFALFLATLIPLFFKGI